MGTPRSAALAALQRWRKDEAWSDAALNAAIQRAGLDRRDAALASRLCYGTIQNLTYLDYYLDLYCTASVRRLEPQVLDILRLGAYQLLFLSQIPAHAAVGESVALCKEVSPRAAGLVNAVLRRLSENSDALPPIPDEGSTQYLSVRYSHPKWFVRRLKEEHGYAFAEAALAANNAETPVCIQTNQCKVDASLLFVKLKEQGFRPEMHPDLPDAMLIPGGNVTDTEEFRAGWFYIQDAAAKIAVLAADPQPGMKVLDACAAPGGKSFAAAVQMKGQGHILACDLHENKLKRIRDGAARLGFAELIETAAIDARNQQGVYDVVLADVPCSGFGVIRKKPEIRFKDPTELEQLPQIQRAILEGLAPCVRPGGVLLYSTCTILPEENEEVVIAFLRDHPEFHLEISPFAPQGMRTFWPHLDGTDGFFLAKLRKQQ